jgi:hypothetical protein
MIDRANAATKEQKGKIRYSPLNEFTSKQIRGRWFARPPSEAQR